MSPQTTSSSRPYVFPFLRNGPLGAGLSHRPNPSSSPNETAYSTDPSRDFAVRMVSPTPRFEIHPHPKPNVTKQIMSNAETTSQVSPADLAKALHALQMKDYLHRALVIDNFRAAQAQALPEEAGKLSLGNLEGSYHPACWSPEAYTPSIEGRELTNPFRSPSVSSASSGGATPGGFVNSEVQDAASRGSFAHLEHNKHPSAVLNLPPTMLPFPSANVAPFPSAVLPFPFELSPLNPTSNPEEPVVFSNEEEARILKHNLGGLL